MDERTIHLKIKIKSLAAEAKIIRHEARKRKGDIRWNLNNHRTSILRYHARCNLLAYAIIKHIPYNCVEKKTKTKPNFNKISSLAQKFGANEELLQSWIQCAKEYIKSNKIQLQKAS